LRSEGEREAQVNAARGRAEALVLDARAKQEALLLEADARAQQQKLMATARAEAASELARVIEAHPAAAEGLRLLLAGDWMGMGQELAKAPGGSVLMVDPQSPASLLAALRGLQNGSTEAAAAQPSPLERSGLQPPRHRAEA
ncbi:MAG: hypothetical protein ACK550_06730, partial [Synechococcaceae cyanobacterium]